MFQGESSRRYNKVLAKKRLTTDGLLHTCYAGAGSPNRLRRPENSPYRDAVL